MKPPITRRKKVSFMNFVKEVAKYRTEGKYMSVSLEYDHHSTSDPKMTYGAYFAEQGNFKGTSPEEVLRKLSIHFDTIYPTEIKDVLV